MTDTDMFMFNSGTTQFDDLLEVLNIEDSEKREEELANFYFELRGSTINQEEYQ